MSSGCGRHWPAQGTYVSKSIKHNEESEADSGEEEHADALQDTDRNMRYLVSFNAFVQDFSRLQVAL